MVALSTLRPGFLGRISMSWGSTQTAARLSSSRGGASSGELSSIEPASFVQPVSPYKRYVNSYALNEVESRDAGSDGSSAVLP